MVDDVALKNSVPPNFFIIGAQRSGTSSLYEYLRQHPQVFITENKEPMYFAYQSDELVFQGPGDDVEINTKAVTEHNDYLRLFRDVKDELAIGEASANYLYYKAAADNIREVVPNAKLIVLLRHPVERAYSSYLYTFRDGREIAHTFEEALDLERERASAQWADIWHYREAGFYYKQLSYYFSIFPDSQIKVVFQKDLKDDPASVLKELFCFLGVDESFFPDVGVVYNQGGKPKKAWLNRVLTHPSSLKRKLRPLMPKFILNAYLHLKHNNLDKPEMSAKTYNQLLQDYRGDIVSLQELLKVDLSDWLIAKDETS